MYLKLRKLAEQWGWSTRLRLTWDVFKSAIGISVGSCTPRLRLTWDVFKYNIRFIFNHKFLD